MRAVSHLDLVEETLGQLRRLDLISQEVFRLHHLHRRLVLTVDRLRLLTCKLDSVGLSGFLGTLARLFGLLGADAVLSQHFFHLTVQLHRQLQVLATLLLRLAASLIAAFLHRFFILGLASGREERELFVHDQVELDAATADELGAVLCQLREVGVLTHLVVAQQPVLFLLFVKLGLNVCVDLLEICGEFSFLRLNLIL